MSYTFQQHKRRVYVYSRIIHFIEYDDDSSVLKIGFNDGSVGTYKNFPPQLYEEFQSSDSKGIFFYKHIHKAGFKFQIQSN